MEKLIFQKEIMQSVVCQTVGFEKLTDWLNYVLAMIVKLSINLLPTLIWYETIFSKIMLPQI